MKMIHGALGEFCYRTHQAPSTEQDTCPESRYFTHTQQPTMANFATLDSLKKGDEEKEKKGNAYYAGGARGAGQGGRFVDTTYFFFGRHATARHTRRAANTVLSWMKWTLGEAEELLGVIICLP